MLPRLRAITRYLGWASPPWKWRLQRGLCPLCGGTRFLSLREGPFLTRCLRCRTNLTNLSALAVIEEHFGGDYTGKSAHELSTYGALYEFLRRNFASFTCSEFFPGKEGGAIVEGIRNEDVQRLTFADGSLDLLTSNQVLEHVPDDLLAFRESCRVLRPGGAMICTLPVYDMERTQQLARLRADGSLEWLGAPEYHDSRHGGPRSAPVFWRHSIHDLVPRVLSAGFSRAALREVYVCQGQTLPQQVLYAVK